MPSLWDAAAVMLHLIGYDLGDTAGGQSWLDRAVMVLAEEAGARLLAEARMDELEASR